nr:MAG TPA: hypothetical protein [Caudoviricetes sp.]
MSKMNSVHSRETLIGKFIAISCCCSPALCGALTASTSCALDATLPSKPLMTVKTKSACKKCSVTINLIYQQGAINYASNRRNCF